MSQCTYFENGMRWYFCQAHFMIFVLKTEDRPTMTIAVDLGRKATKQTKKPN